jgi:hypothetical protein
LINERIRAARPVGVAILRTTVVIALRVGGCPAITDPLFASTPQNDALTQLRSVKNPSRGVANTPVQVRAAVGSVLLRNSAAGGGTAVTKTLVLTAAQK